MVQNYHFLGAMDNLLKTPLVALSFLEEKLPRQAIPMLSSDFHILVTAPNGFSCRRNSQLGKLILSLYWFLMTLQIVLLIIQINLLCQLMIL